MFFFIEYDYGVFFLIDWVYFCIRRVNLYIYDFWKCYCI